jgi:SAM-dependent methyltransferase
VPDWFHRLYEARESFEGPEEEQAFRLKQEALTRDEAAGLCRLLSLAPGARLLDAFCGNGRHAVSLARRGYRVLGVDTARSRIGFAQRWAREEAAAAWFVVADARALPLTGGFDAVLVLGGSFTHCPDWGGNVALLRGLGRVLGPGGVLLIDNPNPFRFWRIQNPQAGPQEEAALSHYDFPLGTGDKAGAVRYYTAPRMAELFEEAGLQVTGTLGGRDGHPYGLQSPRLIVTGRVGAAPI